MIGDTPYGSAQLAAFPRLVEAINSDPHVDLALHVGDVKNGSSVCSDAYFDTVASLFATFRDPLVLTPGDNEWTDCHRPAAVGYVPTERLARLREVFYPEPGRTLGNRLPTAMGRAQRCCSNSTSSSTVPTGVSSSTCSRRAPPKPNVNGGCA